MERSDKLHHSNYNTVDIKDTLQIIHGEEVVFKSTCKPCMPHRLPILTHVDQGPVVFFLKKLV